jgi:hypothetical protein
MELTLKDRQKLIAVTAKKYRSATRNEKTKILFTLINQTGYNRKYVIYILNNEGKINNPALKGRDMLFLCGIKLGFNPLLKHPEGRGINPSLRIKEPRFNTSKEVVEKLRKISASTIDRLLKPFKAELKIKGTPGTKPATPHLKDLIPVMSHYECAEQGDGLWQIDLVQHDGGNNSGEFCYTLTITEVKNTWTVHYALKNKAFAWVFKALNDAYLHLPIPVHIYHSDNGGEFINRALKLWCDQKGIKLTRSRGNRKNDNCWVEQKNGRLFPSFRR